MSHEWDAALCQWYRCDEGCLACLRSCICPCCMIAESRSLFDNSPLLFNLFCVSPCAIRNIVRQGYDIDGTCIGDICITAICPFCSACQLYHQVSNNNSKAIEKVSVKSSKSHTHQMIANDNHNQENQNLIKESENNDSIQNIVEKEN